MASTTMAIQTVRSSGLQARASAPRRATAKTSFVGTQLRSARLVTKATNASRTVTTAAFEREWLKKDPLVLVVGFLGWTIPSAIPVSAFGGQSLFGALNGRIAELLGQFPTGPAVTDDFWLLMVTWHIGLFLTLTLGQIGVQGKRQGYW